MLNRSDFKHLSRNDVITYASKLNELRPEVAAQVIAQYPEFVKLIQSSLSEYRAVLEKIIQSDDGSVEKVYDTADKELDISAESRRLFYETVRKVLDHCEKCFDSASSPEERMQIRDQEIEILRMIDKKTVKSEMLRWKQSRLSMKKILKKEHSTRKPLQQLVQF